MPPNANAVARAAAALAARPRVQLLAALALAVVKKLGRDTVVVDAGNNPLTGWRLARIGDIVLLEKPADAQSPRRIDALRAVRCSSSIRNVRCSRCAISTTES